jgi:hypothetical protein
VNLDQVILARNSNYRGYDDDIQGAATARYSLIGVDTGATIMDVGGNLIGTGGNRIDPMVGPLADNGGEVRTQALLPGSLATNAGDEGLVFDLDEYDQRGAPYFRVRDGRIDIGAFEADLNASPLRVNTDLDVVDATDHLTSLREAILSANDREGEDTISFDPYMFSIQRTILLTLGEMVIADDVEIVGPGRDMLTIDAQQSSRIFNVSGVFTDCSISGMTLTGGQTTGIGGAIRSVSVFLLSLTDCRLLGNRSEGSGGGLYHSGTLLVTDCIIEDNGTSASSAWGGGIFGNSMSLVRCQVTNNFTSGAFADGGGIRGWVITIGDSVIANNTTFGQTAQGGGISASESVRLTNSSVSNNRTLGHGSRGGGIGAEVFVELTDSVVSGNSTIGESAAGGGIYVIGSVVSENCNIVGNSTKGDFAPGGGVFARSEVTLTQSTVSGNCTEGVWGAGGGVRTGGATLIASTINGNRTLGEEAY